SPSNTLLGDHTGGLGHLHRGRGGGDKVIQHTPVTIGGRPFDPPGHRRLHLAVAAGRGVGVPAIRGGIGRIVPGGVVDGPGTLAGEGGSVSHRPHHRGRSGGDGPRPARDGGGRPFGG